jgi:hypothetical protein
MSARKRSRQPKGGFSFPDGEEEPTPKSKRLVKAPEFDTCNCYSESVGLTFDPQRVRLRRVFFLNKGKSKYVYVGFYPALDYQPLVEFEGSLNKRIFNTRHCGVAGPTPTGNVQLHVWQRTLRFQSGLVPTDHDRNFKGCQNVLHYKHYLHFKLAELQYLERIFHVVSNQLKAYDKATPDVKT